MRKKNLFFSVIVSALMLLFSCVPDDHHDIDNSTVMGTVTVNNVSLSISNTTPKLGEELVIKGDAGNAAEVTMTLQCASLGIEEVVKTPFIFKKKMTVEGTHTIIAKSDKSSSEITITVTK